MIARYQHATRAITGTRDRQEDACAFAFPDARALYFTASGRVTGTGELLAVLADGMGGHVAGAEASRTACATFIESYAQSEGLTRDRFEAALTAANAAIAERIAHDHNLEGMGSTLVAAAFGDEGLRWVSVGDSPLFLFRQRRLYQLNEDHSLAPVLDRLAAEGEIEAEAARRHPRRHFLRSALTGAEIELVDLRDRLLPLEPDDWVVLASDGIETLSHAEIADIADRHCRSDVDTLVSALIEAVERADDPRQDNTTIMAVRPCFAETPVA
ncbi:MAG: protein phosphatase 2C domain-containing protein [Hyphomicrobiaceae bacterium]